MTKAQEIVKELAEWSTKYPRSSIYNMHSKPQMDGELIKLEEKAKEYITYLPNEKLLDKIPHERELGKAFSQPVQKPETIELIKIVLRKFYYNDEQAIGYSELNTKLKDWLCEEIGDAEFVEFCDNVKPS